MIFKFIKAVKKINRVQGYISGLLIISTTLVMLYDVIMRYVFTAPSIRAASLASFLMLGAIFIGTAHALWHGGHIHLEVLISKFKPLPKKICLTVGYLFAVTYVVNLANASYNLAVSAAASGRRAMGHLPLPMSFLFGVMVFGLVMLLIALVARLTEIWLAKKGGKA